MDIKKLTGDISVAAQIAPEDVAAVANLGFKTIISNRPDGESPGQPDFSEITAAAARLGIETRYVPVVSGRLNSDDVLAFSAALKDLPGPVLAYCRSGTRSTTLWALSQSGHRPASEIVEIARSAGYDVSGVVPGGRH